ncbi:hypothetical protein BKI52_11475 [marine bacterium AO1-C]|nr:hypothetical protein BKI52_11475 [marine bacterium AO1-C]
MIVFGYYTIPIKSVYAHHLPKDVAVTEGARFDCGLKLAHIMFIPAFPIEKKWLMKHQGQTYETTSHMASLLDDLYGKPRTPWYSYAVFLLGLAALLYFFIEGKVENYRQESALIEASRSQKISPNSYYALKSSSEQYYGVKVDSSSEDKVWVRYLNNDPGYSENKKIGAVSVFMINRGEFKVQAISKKTIVKSHYRRSALIKIEGLNEGETLTLESIYNVDIDKDDIGLYVSDPQTSAEVKQVLKKFVNETSVNSSLALLDSSSKTYLLDVVKTAKTGDVTNMKNFIKENEHPEVNYAMMMYAKYVYLPKLADNLIKTDKRLLSDFGEFSKLLGVGLWRNSSKIKNIKIVIVNVTGKNVALARVSLPSNILGRPSRINFLVKLRRENGQWKINLPSTFSYTSDQIAMMKWGGKAYRERIRSALKAKNKSLIFDVGLAY